MTTLCECRGQAETVPEQKLFLGLGFGFDHGGMGLRLDGRISPYFGVFGGVGATFSAIGVNGGVQARILPNSQWCPYVTAMYGFNGESTTVEEEKLFYGPTFGAGVEKRSRTGPNFFHFGLLIPVHSAEAREVSDNADFPLWPILPTFGWHFATGKKK
ncbi:MAG: hypothetical protein ABI432_17540 [Flavobacteriales bacterium]